MATPLEQAYLDGRDAWYTQEECPAYFACSPETKLMWEQGVESQRRADPYRMDAEIMRSYDCDL